MANINKARKEGRLINEPANKNEYNKKISEAYPSLTHMSLVKMMNKGYLKHIISQNIDGLHRNSGIEAEKISELHGNTNIELVKRCDPNVIQRSFKEG